MNVVVAVRVVLSACLAVAVVIGSATDVQAGRRNRLVWVSLEGHGELAKVDVAEGVLLRVDTRGGGPHNITVAQDGTVVAALWASDRIIIFGDGERRFVHLGGAPHDVKIARNMIVVANQATKRVQLVKLDGTFVRRILLKADPHDLAIDPNERHAWVTLERSDDLAVVDLLDRREPVRYVDTDGTPHDILFAPDETLWVTDWNGALHVIAGRRGRLVESIALGEEAHHLDFTPDGQFAWITDHEAGAVFVLRVPTVNVVERIDFPGEPHHVSILRSGRRAVVADHANGRLVVYDVETREQLRAVSVGSEPHGVWAMGSQGEPRPIARRRPNHRTPEVQR